MKFFILAFVLFCSLSTFANNEYEILAYAKCVDREKVNNAGYLQVKVLRSIYAEESDQSLTVVITTGSRINIAEAELIKLKKGQFQLSFGTGTSGYYLTLKASSVSNEKMRGFKLLKIKTYNEWSIETPPPANYDPTYSCI